MQRTARQGEETRIYRESGGAGQKRRTDDGRKGARVIKNKEASCFSGMTGREAGERRKALSAPTQYA